MTILEKIRNVGIYFYLGSLATRLDLTYFILTNKDVSIHWLLEPVMIVIHTYILYVIFYVARDWVSKQILKVTGALARAIKSEGGADGTN